MTAWWDFIVIDSVQMSHNYSFNIVVLGYFVINVKNINARNIRLFSWGTENLLRKTSSCQVFPIRSTEKLGFPGKGSILNKAWVLEHSKALVIENSTYPVLPLPWGPMVAATGTLGGTDVDSSGTMGRRLDLGTPEAALDATYWAHIVTYLASYH